MVQVRVWVRRLAPPLSLPQHPDEHRPRVAVLLGVDQQLGEVPRSLDGGCRVEASYRCEPSCPGGRPQGRSWGMPAPHVPGSGCAVSGVRVPEEGHTEADRDEQPTEDRQATGEDVAGLDAEGDHADDDHDPADRYEGSGDRRSGPADRHGHEPYETGEDPEHQRAHGNQDPPNLVARRVRSELSDHTTETASGRSGVREAVVGLSVRAG